MKSKQLCKALAFFLFLALALSAPLASWAKEPVHVKLVPMLDGYPAGQSEPLFLMTRLPQDLSALAGEESPFRATIESQNGISAEQSAVLVSRAMPGVVILVMKTSVSPDVKPGPQELKGRLALKPGKGEAWQADFDVKIKVLPEGSQAKEINPGMVSALLASAGLTRAQVSSQVPSAAGAAIQGDQGFWDLLGNAMSSAISGKQGFNLAGMPLWLILLLAFGTGIVLNATPCVYPLIPITVSYFGGRAQGNKGALLGHVFAYWAGMAVMYSVLGALAALSGSILGDALTHPAVLIGLALVFVVLASSMFGFWEIRMPGKLTQAAAANRAGVAGTLLMGLLVGVLAAPCVGPVVIAFIAMVAKVGEVGYGLAVFFFLALGLGLPLSILAFFSGSISRLPGAGEWMVWVRAFFGVILVAMAWFVVRTLVPDDGFFWGMALILLFGGVYLGFVKRMGGPAFRAFSRVIGIAFIIAPVLFWWMGVFTPPPIAGKIAWVNYSQAEVDKPSDRPKVILFTADWCAPCRQLKARTFPDPRVQETISKFVAIKADMSTGGTAEIKQAARKYLVRGVPTIVFLDKKGRVLSNFSIAGFIAPSAFVDRMNAVLKQTGSSTASTPSPPAKSASGG
jgi:thiol:disulfide interchange protein DsbD